MDDTVVDIHLEYHWKSSWLKRASLCSFKQWKSWTSTKVGSQKALQRIE